MKKLLLPFSGIFWIITTFRNLFYDWGIFKSTKFPIKSIIVGNLSTGGTGKSPMTMYLVNLLKDEKLVAVLSRGYKRKTKGFQLVHYHSLQSEVGDEPLQFFKNFKNKIVVAVCENRVFGAKQLINIFNPKILILDDAYQHRKFNADFHILLTDFSNPYYDDYLLPTGNLRESRIRANKAQIIIVTKCPNNLSETDKKYIFEKLKSTQNQSVFFSKIIYKNEIKSDEYTFYEEDFNNFDVLLITGIAKGQDFYEYCKTKFNTISYLKFPDHYQFTRTNVQEILKKFNSINSKNKLILTTEKDYMRLGNFSELCKYTYFMPIDIEIDNKELLNNKILSYVHKN